VGGFAQRGDPGAGTRGPGEEGERGRRRAGRLIGGRDGIAARALGPALAEELPSGRVEQADLAAVPLDGDLTANLPGRAGIVVDLDTAGEVDGPGAAAVVAEGLEGKRQPRRALPGEHGGDLALGGTVDVGVGPARLPAVEIPWASSKVSNRSP
jgi:hypothetical protein